MTITPEVMTLSSSYCTRPSMMATSWLSPTLDRRVWTKGV